MLNTEHSIQITYMLTAGRDYNKKQCINPKVCLLL